MKATRIILISSCGFSSMFGVSSLLFYFGDWTRFLAVTLLGFFIGLIAAPEIEPKAFTLAWLLQLCSGMLAGGVGGWLFQLTFESIAVSIVIGGFVGWLAPFWVKHVSIP